MPRANHTDDDDDGRDRHGLQVIELSGSTRAIQSSSHAIITRRGIDARVAITTDIREQLANDTSFRPRC